jgi:glucose/arabinose dehydrogenase
MFQKANPLTKKTFLFALVFIFYIQQLSCSSLIGNSPSTGGLPQNVEDTFIPDVSGVKVEVWVENLEIPWSLIFLRDGRALVSERPGRIRLISDGKLRSEPYAEIEVAHIGEGGLMGDLFVATLRSESLIRIRLDKDKDGYKVTDIERWFAEDHRSGKFGRIRDVVEGPDGAIYFLTNNTDGRGSPRPGDDRIYRIVPTAF